jgi:glycosyltransferase involved in cell wall biosynthesis
MDTNSSLGATVGRVLIVGPLPPPFGGMAIQAQALVKRLRQDGVDAHLLATNPPVIKWVGRIKGLRTLVQTILYVGNLIRTLTVSRVVHLLGASHWYFVLRVMPTVLLAKLFGRRIILNYRGGEAPHYFARFPRLVMPVLRMVDSIVVPSVYLQRLFNRWGHQATIIPNFVDLVRFQYRQRDSIKPDLLVTRSLEPLYNIPMALKAFGMVQQKYPEARLNVVGGGSEEAALKALVEREGWSGVVFHGAVRNEDIPKFLENADVLLNPTNADNMPVSLLEAFAAGVPVVTTNTGGIPDLVGNEEAALMVNPDDAAALARRIEDLLSQPELVVRLTRQAKTLCEQMNWEHVGCQWIDVYCASPQNAKVKAGSRVSPQ